jgi:hypothetical protein
MLRRLWRVLTLSDFRRQAEDLERMIPETTSDEKRRALMLPTAYRDLFGVATPKPPKADTEPGDRRGGGVRGDAQTNSRRR